MKGSNFLCVGEEEKKRQGLLGRIVESELGLVNTRTWVAGIG